MFDSTVDSNGNSNVDSNVDSDVNSNIDSNVDSNVVSTVGSDVVSIADSDVHSNNWIPMLIQMLFHFESNVDVIFSNIDSHVEWRYLQSRPRTTQYKR